MRARALAPAVLAAALASATAVPPAAAGPGEDGTGRVRAAVAYEELVDLRPDDGAPTDGASASVVAVTGPHGSAVVLALYGLDPAAAGRRLGAHVHVGPCRAGDGAGAGPHYTHAPPPSPATEVWLDLAVDADGPAFAAAFVPFGLPVGAARSIVVHAEPTAPDGSAGDRLACLPLEL